MTHQALKSATRFLAIGAAVLAGLASPSALYAQSCALCYQSAANSGPEFIAALKRGILVLLFPPLLIGIGVVVIAYRKRYQFAEHDEAAAEQ